MRNNIVAGNWKMNNNLNESKKLFKALKQNLKNQSFDKTRIIVAPTYVSLSALAKRAKKSMLEVAAQNMHHEEKGAYTGEVSAKMLKSVGVQTVILGHSERRQYFKETEALLAKKVNTALANDLEIIFCFGEQLNDRKSEQHFKIVESQIKEALFHLDVMAWQNIILAYEPVWAIGTGETASPEQAQEMHAFIRKLVANKYDEKTAKNVSILYGGSVKPDNAATIFSKPDVDGGLIGGAALKADDFIQIINAV